MRYSAAVSKLKRAYAFVAISLLNMIVLILVLNLIAFAVIRLRDAISPPRSVDRQREVYPGMEPADILQLLDETWNQPYQYEPWVGFKERPRSGKYVNISEEGFRHSHMRDLSLRDPGISVYVLGGSTTFGYGLDDGSTIPSHLQRYLTEHYPDKAIRVFNFGRGYYYSTQELALLVQLLMQNHVPQVAIFIDGLNEDQAAPHYSPELAYLFDASNYSREKLLRLAVEKTSEHNSLMRIGRKLLRAAGYQEATKTYPRAREPRGRRRHYLRAREMIRALARRHGFPAYFFVQPVPGYRNSFSNHRLMSQARPPGWNHDLIRQMELLDETVDGESSFSLTGILEDYPQQPFVDDFHYTSAVCRKIAVAIGERIQIP